MFFVGDNGRYAKVLTLVASLYLSAFFSGAIKAESPHPLVADGAAEETKGAAAQAPAKAAGVQETPSRVVVFRLAREDEADPKVPVNIFFDGAYHGSLLPDTRAVEMLSCAASADLRARAGMKQDGGPTLHRKESIALSPGVTYYYQSAIDAEGNAQLRPVDEARARKVVESLSLQRHTHSRVAAERCARK